MLWVAEAFGNQRAVSIFLLEVLGEVTQSEAHAAGGEVGLASGVEDEEAAKLGDQGQTVGAGERIPVDPFVAVFEPQSSSGPAKARRKERESPRRCRCGKCLSLLSLSSRRFLLILPGIMKSCSVLVLLTLAGLWFLLSQSGLPEKEDPTEPSAELRDSPRRDENRLTESDILGAGYSWEKVGGLILRPGDPLPDLKLDPKSFSERYRAILADDSLSHRDRGTKLDLLAKSYVIKNGIEASLAGLHQFFGEGRIKNRIIATMFQYAEASQGELAGLVADLKTNEEQEWAYSALFSRIPREGFIDPALFDFFPLPEHAAGGFSDFIVPLVGRKNLSLEQGIDFMTQAFGREVSDDRMTHYLRRLMEGNPEPIVQFCLTEIDDSSPVRDRILRFYLTDEMARSPEAGFNSLLELSRAHPEAIGGEHFSHAMGEFLKTDRRKALEWFKESADQLPDQTKDAMQGAIVLDSANDEKFQAAWDQLESIGDRETREQVERHLWDREAAVVSEEVSRDPQGLMENLMTGASPHPEFWIKQGFQGWHQANAHDANSWYAENQTRLNPSQTQHVARAYAEIALGEGDLDLARQWTGQVVDPAFRQKLIDQIDAATQAD